METISPDHQYPTKVISPPLTPFNITIASHQHILPPIRSLPTWNRTKLGIRRAPGPIPLNNNNILKTVAITTNQSEQCTQTSPASSATSRQEPASSIAPLCKSPVEKNNLKTAYEKKIVFLQTSHEYLLTSLHDEVEQLKSENKELNFNLVNARDQLEQMKIEAKYNERSEHGNDNNVEVKLANRVKVLEQQLDEIKSELQNTKESNKQLLEIVQHTKSNNSRQSSSLQFKKPSRLNAGINNDKRNASTRTKSYHKEDKTIEVSKNIIQDGNSNENCCSSNGHPLVKNLSCQLTNRSDNEYFLPKINSSNKQLENKNISPRDKDEPIKLPVLQSFPFPSTNVSLRRKRTKALQSQKYRSGKELGVYLAPK